jgi:Protein of unknown function (DUF4019)
MKSGRARRIIVGTVLASVLTGCAAVHGVDHEQSLVTSFHEQLDRQAYGSIYDAADQIMKDRVTRVGANRYLGTVHRTVGAVVSSSVEGWKIQTSTRGTFVAIKHKTTFRRRAATESFTFRRDGSNSGLVGYDNSEVATTN